MKTKMGLWIDHRRAVIVAVSDKGEEIKQIASHAERQYGRMEGARSVTSYRGRQLAAEDIREREYRGHLQMYYDQVISNIKDAEAVLIMGPGMAKGELKRRIEQKRLSERIAKIETVDKMPESKIAAKVRNYFAEPKSSEFD